MELLNTHPVKKSDLGFHGNLFGGKLLAWLDASAAGYAAQFCDTPRMLLFQLISVYLKDQLKKVNLLKYMGLLKK